MANTINSNLSALYKNVGAMGKKTNGAGKGKNVDDEQKAGQLAGSDILELSGEGLAALARQRKKALDNADDGSGAMSPDEKKLSPKAQEFLTKLREKYGDYDFIAAEHIDDPAGLTKGSTKAYSVILTNDEIERMANDEAYADEVMEKVGAAVDMTKRIEEKGELGEGVRFRHIAISFDDDGNMKLFAELEKMSDQQAERMKAAQEKRAEEKKEADRKAEKDRREEPPFRRLTVEATSEEEFMEKLLALNWEDAEEEQ